jgi:hypothetical protein
LIDITLKNKQNNLEIDKIDKKVVKITEIFEDIPKNITIRKEV